MSANNNYEINDRVAWVSSLNVGGRKVEFVGTIVELVDTVTAQVRPDAPQHGLTQTDIDHPNGPRPIVKLHDLKKL